MHELTLTIPTEWALPAILTTGALLCATACAMWRGGYAAGLADGRNAHLLHLEEDEASLQEALDAAEKRFEEATRPRMLTTTLCSTETTDAEERAAGPLPEFQYHELAAPLRTRAAVRADREKMFPEAGSYFAAALEGSLWGRFRALEGGRSLQSYHFSRMDAESGLHPIPAARLPFGGPYAADNSHS